MSTYDASLIRVAGKKHDCADCGAVILKWSRYLAYKPGLHSTHKLCMPCAISINRNTGKLNYQCRSIEAEIATRSVSETGEKHE